MPAPAPPPPGAPFLKLCLLEAQYHITFKQVASIVGQPWEDFKSMSGFGTLAHRIKFLHSLAAALEAAPLT